MPASFSLTLLCYEVYSLPGTVDTSAANTGKTMNTCNNCRLWGVDLEGVCDFVNTVHADNPDTGFSIVANADDDQGLVARLHTAPNFGCVNFQRR